MLTSSSHDAKGTIFELTRDLVLPKEVFWWTAYLLVAFDIEMPGLTGEKLFPPCSVTSALPTAGICESRVLLFKSLKEKKTMPTAKIVRIRWEEFMELLINAIGFILTTGVTAGSAIMRAQMP